MPSRVTLFNHFGFPIAEANTSTTRSWILNDVGRCQFNLATSNNPVCTRTNLQYGNFVLVEHIPTRDSLGNMRGTLPPWIGVILPPLAFDYGFVTVTAYSAEDLLLYDPMPQKTESGSPGSIFTKIIGYANLNGGFIIYPGSFYDDGTSYSVTLALSAEEEIKNLVKSYTQDWDVTFQVNSNKQLKLFANWYSQKGVVTNAVLSEGTNGNMKYPKLTEQGTISNLVFGVGQSSKNGRSNSTQRDVASQSDYGVLGINTNITASGAAAVTNATLAFLNTNSRPTITLDLTALDSGNTFSGLAVGNVWNVVLKSVGFFAGSTGFSGQVRLTGIEYDDYANEAKLTTQVLTTGLTEANYA